VRKPECGIGLRTRAKATYASGSLTRHQQTHASFFIHSSEQLMSTSADLRRLALSLVGTTEAPHFDRTAFKARRIYVTLAPDGKTANFIFTPEQQEFKCMMAPKAFSPVPNAWGQRGATTAILSRLNLAELEDALRTAWSRALSKKAR
jgi:hypothetical protein